MTPEKQKKHTKNKNNNKKNNIHNQPTNNTVPLQTKTKQLLTKRGQETMIMTMIIANNHDAKSNNINQQHQSTKQGKRLQAVNNSNQN